MLSSWHRVSSGKLKTDRAVYKTGVINRSTCEASELLTLRQIFFSTDKHYWIKICTSLQRYGQENVFRSFRVENIQLSAGVLNKQNISHTTTQTYASSMLPEWTSDFYMIKFSVHKGNKINSVLFRVLFLGFSWIFRSYWVEGFKLHRQ